MKIEVGIYYKTRDGCRAYVVCIHEKEYIGFYYARGEYRTLSSWNREGYYHMNSASHNLDLIAEWEDEPEEIDVSQMFVVVKRNPASGEIFLCSDYLKEKDTKIKHPDVVAQITVHKWLNIQAGNESLIVGEGL